LQRPRIHRFASLEGVGQLGQNGAVEPQDLEVEQGAGIRSIETPAWLLVVLNASGDPERGGRSKVERGIAAACELAAQ
jgi:hypothetical protein